MDIRENQYTSIIDGNVDPRYAFDLQIHAGEADPDPKPEPEPAPAPKPEPTPEPEPKDPIDTLTTEQILELMAENKKLKAVQDKFKDLEQKYDAIAKQTMDGDAYEKQKQQEYLKQLEAEREEILKKSKEKEDMLKDYQSTLKKMTVESEIAKIASKLGAVSIDALLRDTYLHENINYDYKNKKVKANGHKSVEDFMAKYKEDNPHMFSSYQQPHFNIAGNVGNGGGGEDWKKMSPADKIKYGLRNKFSER